MLNSLFLLLPLPLPLHHHHHHLLLLLRISSFILMVHSSIQNSSDFKQQSIIRKWKDNNNDIEKIIKQFDNAEEQIKSFIDKLMKIGDEYKQVNEYVNCLNEYIEVNNELKLIKEIYLNESKTMKDCFKSQASIIQQRITDYPEEKCLEFIPHNDKNEVINFGDSGYLNSLIDSRVSNIYWINYFSFETETQKPENLLEISTTTTTTTLIPSITTEQMLTQKAKLTAEAINGNTLNKKHNNEINTVQNETMKNHTQFSIIENSSFEGNFYLVYLGISILLVIFSIGVVYLLCNH
ncbi:unnamed protein product [Schistosoma spindalis]|nr:unnamed protein product [Schistosoma spindale]